MKLRKMILLTKLMLAVINPLERPQQIEMLSAHYIELERQKKATALRPNWFAAI